MLSGEGNENGKKKKNNNNNRCKQQKSNFARAAHFFCTFSAVLHECNVKLPETSQLHVLWRKCRTCSCSLFFFSLSLIFTLVAPSIPSLQNFILFLQQKMSPLVFSLSLKLLFQLSFAGLSPYFLFFSVFLFLYIPNLWT